MTYELGDSPSYQSVSPYVPKIASVAPMLVVDSFYVATSTGQLIYQPPPGTA